MVLIDVIVHLIELRLIEDEDDEVQIELDALDEVDEDEVADEVTHIMVELDVNDNDTVDENELVVLEVDDDELALSDVIILQKYDELDELEDIVR